MRTDYVQMIDSDSGSLCRRPIPPSNPEQDPAKYSNDEQAPTAGPHGNQATNTNGHQAPQHNQGDYGSHSSQQNGAAHGAQHEQHPPFMSPPYRGIPGYYTYGGYPGVPYDSADADQYLYQYNYNGLHPYWRNTYRSDDYDEQWDESQ